MGKGRGRGRGGARGRGPKRGKKNVNPKGCVAFCRLRDGNIFSSKIAVRYCFLKFAQILKNMQKIEMLKSYRMCRFLPPLGRHQKWCPNLRYLVFFEIRKNFEKDAKNKIIKII